MHEEIMKIVQRTSSKYIHDIYEKEDIKQEAYVAALEAANSYEESKGPFENYISRCVNNYLINLCIRDNRRKEVYSAESLSYLNDDSINICYEEDRYDSTDRLMELKSEFPSELRKDYLKLIGGVKITNKRKNDIKQFISENLQT